MYKCVVEKSTRNDKKLMVTVFKKSGAKYATVHFGATGYSDYTIHQNSHRRDLYIERHRKKEDWTIKGINTPGFWSRWLIWSCPTLKESAKLIERKFKVTVELKRNAYEYQKKKVIRGKDRDPKPANPTLYAQVVKEAKKKFDVWPSIYASSWVVSTYKKRGGTYTIKRTKPDATKGLTRWYKEKWVNVCKLPKVVDCGRTDMKNKYPLCRPMYRITKDTPKTVGELSQKELERRCKEKRKDPSKRVF